MTEPGQKTQRNMIITIAAMLVIISGVLSLMNGLAGLLSNTVVSPLFPSASSTLASVCSILLVLFGVIAIAGGLYAFRPKARISPVLLGAALGMLGGGDIGFWFGLAAIALLWWSNSDF